MGMEVEEPVVQEVQGVMESEPTVMETVLPLIAVLAVGEHLMAHPAERSVVIALFDTEEPGFYLGPDMGSIRFYREQRVGPIAAAVVLDLVGHKLELPGLELQLGLQQALPVPWPLLLRMAERES